MTDTVVQSIYIHRQSRLASAIKTAGMDAVAINAGPTLTYLTGLHFHLSERPVVGIFAPERPVVMILPELEGGKLGGLPYPLEAFQYGEDPLGWGRTFKTGAEAARLDGRKVGVEPRCMRVLELRYLESAAPGAGFTSAEDLIAGLRMRKDVEEIDAMRRAVAIAQQALEATMPLIRLGMSERELAAELTLHVLRHGSDPEIPFSPIVASGPNSANPHAYPTDRRLETSDMLVVDWGASHVGYFSDLTRTFAIGRADPEMTEIARIVMQANAAGREAVKPGVTAGEVDRAARTVIETAGYGEYFMHRTGHGLGLEIHEEPYIFSGNPHELDAGMTFTIEPGIYLPGRGGVRIEDNVVVTDTGAESLSDLPRDLLQIGD